MIDLGIVIAYFAIIFTIGLRARASASVGPEEFFLSSRSLRWPSIAMSTIATNIEAGHFLSVAGAAYVDGLAQGNFELNAIFGIVVAAFFFVPPLPTAERGHDQPVLRAAVRARRSRWPTPS